ncbi:MAG TPA: hypothetical protein ENJ43_01425 [Gammaproteobacteria bacterium]|nr:hypothetical protein [Gammaproteobacteria bacterium]
MTFNTCLGCHGDPKNAPAPVKIGYLPDRHHLRVDTPIDPDYSASPYPDLSPDGTHKCITCHKVDWVEDSSKPLGGYFKFALEPTDPQFRDCLNCHKQKKKDGRLVATVHHLTDKAQKKLCYQCHGSLVNNATDDHRVPDQANAPDPGKARHCGKVMPEGDRNFYDISIITPWPGDNYKDKTWQTMLDTIYSDCPDFAKRYYDPNVLDGQFNINPPRYKYEMDSDGNIQAILVPDGIDEGRRTGNCEHCHYQGENPGDDVQANTGLAKDDIGTNMSNHHSTGVGQLGSGSVHTCSLCHAPEDPPIFTIRGCEVCHAISTVHAIEFDADGDGIDPGNEKTPFMGHIGNDINCRGCHLNFRTGQTYQASELGKIPPGYQGPVPSVTTLSTDGMIAGTATDLTITGSGFYTAIDIGDGRTVEAIPRIELVGSDNSVTEIALDRADVTETSIDVTLPASLKPDTYELYVVKGRYDPEKGGRDYSQRSGARSFLVAPNANIDAVSCSNGKVTITGSGFGNTFVAGSDSMGVLGDGSNCSIESWSDTQIVANCGSGTGTVTVDGLFGEASSDAACGGTDDSGRPKWWSIWSWWSSWSWSRR